MSLPLLDASGAISARWMADNAAAIAHRSADGTNRRLPCWSTSTAHLPSIYQGQLRRKAARPTGSACTLYPICWSMAAGGIRCRNGVQNIPRHNLGEVIDATAERLIGQSGF